MPGLYRFPNLIPNRNLGTLIREMGNSRAHITQRRQRDDDVLINHD